MTVWKTPKSLLILGYYLMTSHKCPFHLLNILIIFVKNQTVNPAYYNLGIIGVSCYLSKVPNGAMGVLDPWFSKMWFWDFLKVQINQINQIVLSGRDIGEQNIWQKNVKKEKKCSHQIFVHVFAEKNVQLHFCFEPELQE